PCSTSCIIADVVPITLVSDARSHSVWAFGFEDRRQSRCPTLPSASTPRESPITTYAPGKALSFRAPLRTRAAESRSSRASPARRTSALAEARNVEAHAERAAAAQRPATRRIRAVTRSEPRASPCGDNSHERQDGYLR